MKRILTVFFSLCLALGVLTGCQSEDKPKDSGDDIQSQDIQATLYLPNEQADGFETKTVKLAQDTPQALVDALVEQGALPEGSQAISFDQQQESLSMSQDFVDAVSTTGTAKETMLMGALVNTFLTHYELEEISVTGEDGAVIESGHNVYDEPMGMIE